MRRKNLYREGSINSSGSVMPPGVSAIPVLDRCIEEAQARLSPLLHDIHSRKRRGIGFASGAKNVGYSFGFPDQATCTVELVVLDGVRAARVRIGAADVGQGAHLILRQIAAETLSLQLDAVTIIAEDSAEAPNAGSASASRMTLMGGRAVKDACEMALKNLATDGVPSATVQFKPKQTTPFDEYGRGTPHFCYGYVAQAVEVEVDMTTGEVAVLNVISVNDVGRAINKQQVEAQIEGCIAQAIGYALTEDFRIKDRPHPHAAFQQLLAADCARRAGANLFDHHGNARSARPVRRPRDVRDAARPIRRRRRKRDPRRHGRLVLRHAVHPRTRTRRNQRPARPHAGSKRLTRVKSSRARRGIATAVPSGRGTLNRMPFPPFARIPRRQRAS